MKSATASALAQRRRRGTHARRPHAAPRGWSRGASAAGSRAASATLGAASSTCSRLSRTSSVRRSRLSGVVAERLSDRRQDELRVANAASVTKNTPSGKSSTSSAAAWSASRVFPEPPGPVSVSTPSSRRSRPDFGDLAVAPDERCRLHRQIGRPILLRSGGNSGLAELEQALRLGQVLEPVLAEVANSASSSATKSCVVCDIRTCPPCAAQQILAAVCTSRTDVPGRPRQEPARPCASQCAP